MENKHILPLYFPGKSSSLGKFLLLAADLKKNTSTLALYNCENGKMERLIQTDYATEEFPSFSEMAQKFLTENSVSGLSKVSISVPGPVIAGKCITQNIPWQLDERTIQADLGAEKAYLVNDLEATAYSFAEFDKDLLETLHTSDEKIRGNVAILAPGNGLGEAGLFFDGRFLRPFATEGGHTEFSPRTDFEVEFYHFLKKIYGIVAWENVLSKTGLYDIYRFLRDVGKQPEDPHFAEKIKSGDFLKAIAEAGKDGKSQLVNLTLEMYGEFLAREANSLVLKLKAIGGLIITGEIPENIFGLINQEKFYKDFLISDRMEHLLKDIPIYLVKNPESSLQGAAYYGAFIEENAEND